MLGPLVLRSAEGSVAVEGARRRAVLASLLARPGRTVGADDLVDAAWPQVPPAGAVHSLHSLVSRLRGLGVAVTASDGGYRLDARPDDVDAGRFDALLARATDAPPDAAVAVLEQALALWRGPAFGGAAELPTVRGEAQRLEERRRQATEQLATRLVEAGRAEEAVGVATRLTAEEPARETAWVALVRALVAAGRPADGVEAHARAVAALDELGLLPSPALRAAQAEALGAPTSRPPSAGGRTAPQPTKPTKPPPRTPPVPVPASSLLGREDDVTRVGALLDGARLVTLVGPGGVGKTRVALEVARRRAGRHASGGRVVELTTLTDPASVPAAVLAALGVGTQGGPVEAGLRRAGELDVLVVLDSCEHVLDAVAEVLEVLLAGGRARVLATSRERVGVAGEHVHAVDPLPTTGADPAARRLFVDRAVQAGALGGPEALDPALVDRVVRRLDGLPLAIEMAAARTATLHLDELAAGLESELDAEIALLRDPRRHGADRHRTLRAVIAWSERFLGPAEHDALRRWPVFAGPVEAADAAAVVDAPRAVVEQLVQRSLLVVDPARPTGATRYRMLRTVASAVTHGWGPPTDEDRARHAAHLLAVASASDARRRTSDEAAGVARLRSTVAELRAAHAWARGHDPHLGARLSRALHTTAVTTMDDETLGWAALLGPLLDGDPDASVAHAAVAARLLKAGELDAAAERAGLALAAATTDVDRMHALDVLTDVPVYAARFDECRARAAELREAALAARDPYYVAVVGAAHGLCAAYEGDPDRAHAELGECRTLLSRRFDDVPPSALGWLDYVAGEAEVERDPAAALAPLERALATADRVGNRYLGGVARVSVASVRARHGDPVDAVRTFAEVVRWWLDRGDRTHLLTTLRNLVDLLLRTGATTATAELWGAVEAPGVSPSFGPERERLDRAHEALAARLPADRLAEAVAVGRTRGVEAAAQAALDALRGPA